MEIRHLTEEHACTDMAVADAPSAAIAIRGSTAVQFLEHENRARHRRIKGCCEAGTGACCEEHSAVRPGAPEDLSNKMGNARSHLDTRALATEREPGTNRKQPAEELHRYQAKWRLRQFTVEHRLDVRNAAA